MASFALKDEIVKEDLIECIPPCYVAGWNFSCRRIGIENSPIPVVKADVPGKFITNCGSVDGVSFIYKRKILNIRSDTIRHTSLKVKSRIPEETQLTMWDILYQMETEPDCLQVINLYVKDGVQHIVHHQEYPAWEVEHTISTVHPVTEKVFILIEQGLETMILAEDYQGGQYDQNCL